MRKKLERRLKKDQIREREEKARTGREEKIRDRKERKGEG